MVGNQPSAKRLGKAVSAAAAVLSALCLGGAEATIPHGQM